jgi:uncharacterized membrane protein YcaP (DUF421 family)
MIIPMHQLFIPEISIAEKLIRTLAVYVFLLAGLRLAVRFLYSHPGLEKIVEGESDCLISGGKILQDNLKRETITVAERELAARRQGFEGLDDVESCQLEVGGALTFVARRPTETEARHRELLDRLDSVASGQARLAERLDTIQGNPAR